MSVRVPDAWDGVALAGLTVALVAGVFVTPALVAPLDLCVFHRLARLDCPGCGLTRAFLLIPRGEFAQALRLNVASLPLYGLFMAFWCALLSQRLGRPVLARPVFIRIRTIAMLAILVLLVGHWSYKTYVYFSSHSLVEYVRTIRPDRR